MNNSKAVREQPLASFDRVDDPSYILVSVTDPLGCMMQQGKSGFVQILFVDYVVRHVQCMESLESDNLTAILAEVGK